MIRQFPLTKERGSYCKTMIPLPLIICSLFCLVHVGNGVPITPTGLTDIGHGSILEMIRPNLWCYDRQCKPGEQATECTKTDPNTATCVHCPSGTYQPNNNSLFLKQKCIIKKHCSNGVLNDPYSTTKDNDCKCLPTEHKMDKSCIRNKQCDIGSGIDGKGQCVHCIKGESFSDVKSASEPCKDLRKCDQCVILEETETTDRKCGVGLQCNSLKLKTAKQVTTSPTPPTFSKDDNETSIKEMIIDIVVPLVGVIVLAIIVLLIVYFVRRSNQTNAEESSNAEASGQNNSNEAFQQDTLDDIQNKSNQDKDVHIKVMRMACTVLGERLGSDLECLFTNLFPSDSPTILKARWENFNLDYKDCLAKDMCHKMVGIWQQELGPDANVTALVTALKNSNRTDIVEEIVNRINGNREDYGLVESESTSNLLENIETSTQRQETSV